MFTNLLVDHKQLCRSIRQAENSCNEMDGVPLQGTAPPRAREYMMPRAVGRGRLVRIVTGPFEARRVRNRAARGRDRLEVSVPLDCGVRGGTFRVRETATRGRERGSTTFGSAPGSASKKSQRVSGSAAKRHQGACRETRAPARPASTGRWRRARGDDVRGWYKSR